MSLLISGVSSGLGRYLNETFVSSTSYDRSRHLRFATTHFDTIIHCASGMPPRLTLPSKYVEDHCSLVSNLLSISHNKFVYISSADVNASVRTLYAQMKLKVEELVAQCATNYLILRPSLLIGPYMRANQFIKSMDKQIHVLSLHPDSTFSPITYHIMSVLCVSALSGVIQVRSALNLSLGEVAYISGSSPVWGSYLYTTPSVNTQYPTCIADLDASELFLLIHSYNLTH